MTRYVAYYRVSTDKQERSGLGLEAQQEAVTRFLREGDRLVQSPFVETESGKNNDRPMLAEALAACRETGASLLVAKLDRLARDVAFIAALMNSDVPFVACDMPEANRLTVHIMAAFAEHEREMISQRTKAALAAAKARGVKLGGYRGYKFTNEERLLGLARAEEARRSKAKRTAYEVLPVIEEIKATGVTSLGGIARALNDKGVKTARGGLWQSVQVQRLLKCIGSV